MDFFNDSKISWKAKGILSYFLNSHSLSPKELEEISKEGRDSIYSAINELIENDYIQRVELRQNGKFTSVEYKINKLKLPYTENTKTKKVKKSPSVCHDFDLEYLETERLFKDMLKYDQIVLAHNEGDIELLDEILMNIMDMYYSESTTVNKDRKPQMIIRSVLLKLDPGKVMYVLDQYKSVTAEIKNPKGYLQTVIYNSVFEEKSRYENWKKSIDSQNCVS